MLTKAIKIDNLTQDENKLFWQLIQYKRDDRDVKNSVTNLLVDPVFVQCFNTFLPSLEVITLNFREQLVLGIVTMYPESPNKTRFCLDSYLDFEFTWWQKLLKFPKVANLMRDRLIFEDISLLENLYPTFNHKITLKNDTPAELAMNYLQTWHQ